MFINTLAEFLGLWVEHCPQSSKFIKEGRHPQFWYGPAMGYHHHGSLI
jgi:hypothetical protein